MANKPREIYKNRLKFLLCIIVIMFIVCAAFTYKAIFYEDVTESVLANQYVKNIMLAYPRGTIYDRNSIPLTNRNSEYPFLALSDNPVDCVAKNLIGDVEIDENNTTRSGCKGISGLQRYYDSLLNGGSAVGVYSYVDANGNTVDDNYYVSSNHINEGGNVYLTIDYYMQKTIEETIAKCADDIGFDYAAVILTEVNSGKIRAMASYGGYMNQAVLSYQPGSIMKIITALTAYDMGIIDDNTKYLCTSSVNVGGEQKGCIYETAHGEITISEAFALSCNCCFYDLAKKLTYTSSDGKLCSYMLDNAKKWGFNEYGKDAQNKFILEYDGYDSFVPSEIFNDMDIFNSALGQGNTQASAYLINNITTSIASEGTSPKAYITEKLTDSAGSELTNPEKAEFDLGLKKETLIWLKNAMKETYLSGTASSVDFSFCGGIAGKTGTAENIDGALSHAWFSGFYPMNEAKYAITVIIPNIGSSHNALILAKEVISEIEKLEIE